MLTMQAQLLWRAQGAACAQLSGLMHMIRRSLVMAFDWVQLTSYKLSEASCRGLVKAASYAGVARGGDAAGGACHDGHQRATASGGADGAQEPHQQACWQGHSKS